MRGYFDTINKKDNQNPQTAVVGYVRGPDTSHRRTTVILLGGFKMTKAMQKGRVTKPTINTAYSRLIQP
jgi:hypothetical protein